MDKSQQVFLELLRAGLWGDVKVNGYRLKVKESTIDWREVYRLAEEQSVMGLVAAGIESVQEVHGFNVPQEWALQFIGATLQIEQTNKAMNAFVARLIDRLCKQGIYSLLVKGQGIAQCYEKPLWRSSGDVDLFLSGDNYNKAAESLKAVASSVDEENAYNKHLAMTIDGWSVELHGTLRSGLWRSLDRALDDVQNDVFFGGKVRSWMNGGTQVFLPAADEDVVFIFAHILQHFYKEGIGLRQICDWCRLLWTYKDSLNRGLLESRIRNAGIMTEWKAFYNLAHRYLDLPDFGEGIMVLETSGTSEHSSKHDSRFDKKADKVMAFVLETGNFGHNRDYSYYQKYPYVVFKTISLWRHIADTYRYFCIFPFDSLKVLWRKICVGTSVAIRGKKHE